MISQKCAEEMMDKKNCNKYAILVIIQVIIALALLPGCFRENKLIYSVVGEELVAQQVQTEMGYKVNGDYIHLSPGVYQVQVKSNVLKEQFMTVEMTAEDAFYKSIQTNVVPIFPGDEYIDVAVYVLDTVSEAYVQCEFTNMDVSGLLQIEVYKTARGERMLLFLLLVGFGVLDGMLLFRKQILSGKVSQKQQMVFWVMIVGVLLAYFPYLTDYFYLGADTVFHLGRVSFLKDTLLQGADLPIRIQDTWLYEHGYAVSIFYGDLLIYIPAVLMLIGFSLMFSFKTFILIMLIATAIISYMCLKKCVRDEYAALFGTIIYLWAPYYIFNIYNRSAIGEFTAMTFLPLIYCGLYLLYTENVSLPSYKKYKWYIVLGMSVIMQCHIITTELTVILMAVFCVCFWKKTFKKEIFFQLAQAVGLVLLINAWFWVPLLYMMGADTFYLHALSQSEMQERGLSFASYLQILPNNGSAQIGMYCCEPVHIGAGALMLLLLYPIWKLYRKKKETDISWLYAFCVATLVMSTRYFPWDILKEIPLIGDVVSSLQFPSRWMIWAILFVSMFAAFFYKRIMKEGGKLIKVALCIVVVLTIGTVVYHVNSVAFNIEPTYLYVEENMGTNSVGNGEYVLAETKISDIYYHQPKADDGLEYSQYNKVGTDVSIMLRNTTDKICYVEIPLMGYKGYCLEAENTDDMPYITEECGTHGDLRIAVPAGYKGEVRISYKGFLLFRIAEVVSLVSLLAILGWYLCEKRRRL